MAYRKMTLAFLVLIFVQACEQPDTYPISGEACGPVDPVQDLTVDDCTPTV
ncbi:hypothetical protein [Tateyamaria pelophila]|uniref:hypothetical protein n=1 Tax=Tateyamaria pelophila TaxID=328415 RepID=UPI001CBAE1B8|nr:hypothetical protein [Tateyamaria pelophila]